MAEDMVGGQGGAKTTESEKAGAAKLQDDTNGDKRAAAGANPVPLCLNE